MNRTIVVCTLIAALTPFFGGNASLYASDYKIITDMNDNRIEVPVNPKRIVSIHGVSSERIMILGKGPNMVFVAPRLSQWAYKLYPEMRHVQSATTPAAPNVEDMMRQHVDLLLYSPIPVDTKKFRAAGVRTACGFSAGKRPRTLNDFLDNFKRQFHFFGELLGPEAKVRADRYCNYFDRKVKQILARTAGIAPKDRPTVYYGGRMAINGGGANLLATQGKDSVLHWNVEVAGGNYHPQAIDQNFADVNREQVLVWNPDVILVSGWGNTLEKIGNDPKWASLKAIRDRKVYLIPQGVFAWEYASGESILLMIYMAKIFHPELFKDWDMKKEMKTFYSEVYGKHITDVDAERILRNLPPT